jgi:hypothetical protein
MKCRKKLFGVSIDENISTWRIFKKHHFTLTFLNESLSCHRRNWSGNSCMKVLSLFYVSLDCASVFFVRDTILKFFSVLNYYFFSHRLLLTNQGNLLKEQNLPWIMWNRVNNLNRIFTLTSFYNVLKIDQVVIWKKQTKKIGGQFSTTVENWDTSENKIYHNTIAHMTLIFESQYFEAIIIWDKYEAVFNYNWNSKWQKNTVCVCVSECVCV